MVGAVFQRASAFQLKAPGEGSRLTWRNPGLKNYIFWGRPGGCREGSGGFREASGGILGGGFAPPDPPTGWYVHLTSLFLDFDLYFFVILGSIFRRFSSFPSSRPSSRDT